MGKKIPGPGEKAGDPARESLCRRICSMGSVIGNPDSQVVKVFLGSNLTRSTKDYDKMLADENLSEEDRKRIIEAKKKKEEDEIIL